jgi:SAM-dependent methyltransferase
MADQTIDFYDQNALVYSAGSTVNNRLAAFLKLVTPGGLVLELGTGSGRDARAMIDAGFQVDPTDASTELAAIAEGHIGQPVRHMRFQELAARDEYDGVYASASLLHAPRGELIEIITRIYNSLRGRGVTWASFKSGVAEGFDALGRYYNYFGADELALYWQAAAPWSTLEIESWHGSGYDGQPTSWLGVTAIR